MTTHSPKVRITTSLFTCILWCISRRILWPYVRCSNYVYLTPNDGLSSTVGCIFKVWLCLDRPKRYLGHTERVWPSTCFFGWGALVRTCNSRGVPFGVTWGGKRLLLPFAHHVLCVSSTYFVVFIFFSCRVLFARRMTTKYMVLSRLWNLGIMPKRAYQHWITFFCGAPR